VNLKADIEIVIARTTFLSFLRKQESSLHKGTGCPIKDLGHDRNRL